MAPNNARKHKSEEEEPPKCCLDDLEGRISFDNCGIMSFHLLHHHKDVHRYGTRFEGETRNGKVLEEWDLLSSFEI